MELNFPVFAFQKNDNMIYVFFDERKLKSTNIEILRDVNYKGIKLIDSNGNVYIIDKAYKVKYVGFYGFSFLKKGRQILVDFEFDSNVKTIELPDFKNEILSRIDKMKYIWESAWDIEDLKSRIMNSNSFEEIASLIK